MINGVKENLQKYNLLNNNETVLAAISGGPDSMAMLYCLHQLSETLHFKLIVAHVNHGVRGDLAKRDQKFVESEAKKLGLDYYTCDVDMVKHGRENKMTAEEAGRLLRYGFFRKVLKENGGGLIAVAHNKNDQAETVLHRIIRGTGLDGLRAMTIKSGDIIRPLINISREEIEDFIEKNGIDTMEDHTNFQTVYTRNKIRLELLPYLRDNFNPNIIDSLYRLSEIAQSDLEVLEMEMEKKYNKMVKKTTNNSIIFKGNRFMELSEGSAKRLIRKAIHNLLGDINGFGEKHIQSIADLFHANKTGKSVDVGRNVLAWVSYGDFGISLDHARESKLESLVLEYGKNIMADWNMIVTVEEVGELSHGHDFSIAYIDKAKIEGELVLRQRQAGDRIRPLGMKGTKKVKDLFIDKKIPRDMRDRIPIIADSKEVIWIPEQAISRNYKADASSETIIKLTVEELEGEKN